MLLRQKLCAYCSAPFETTKATRIYCSQKCHDRRANHVTLRNRKGRPREGPLINCEFCGREFRSWDNSPRSRSRFCSCACAMRWKVKTGIITLKFRPVPEWVCKQCGITFLRRTWSGIVPAFCTDRCKMEFTRSQKTTKACSVCGRICVVDKLNASRFKYCSNTCYRKTSGRKPRTRQTLIASGREQVCADCGYRERPEILQAHHKDEDRTNDDLDNLELLCPNCHAIRHLPALS